MKQQEQKPQGLKLIIVPTGGIKWSDEAGRWVPTNHGKMRADRIIQLFKDGCKIPIAIIGGKRTTIDSEAKVYQRYVVDNCPGISEWIVIVDAKETCTNRDLPAAKPDIDRYLAQKNVTEFSDIYVTTYYEHFKRIRIVLEHLGFKNIRLINSEEARAYNLFMEFMLTVITRLDPKWKGWRSLGLGLLLVWLANHQRLQQEKHV